MNHITDVSSHMPFVLVTGTQIWCVGMWYTPLLVTRSQARHLDTPWPSVLVTGYKYNMWLNCVVICLVTRSLIWHLGKSHLLPFPNHGGSTWSAITTLCFSNQITSTAHDSAAEISNLGTKQQTQTVAKLEPHPLNKQITRMAGGIASRLTD